MIDNSPLIDAFVDTEMSFEEHQQSCKKIQCDEQKDDSAFCHSPKSCYDDFPSIGLATPSQKHPSIDMSAELAFSGESDDYVVCFVDMVGSTKSTAAMASDSAKVARYYSIFINSIATIAKNFGANIIKNGGDCVIYCFKGTSQRIRIQTYDVGKSLLDAIQCGITMTAASEALNSITRAENLPPIAYRVSADYGRLEVAKSMTSGTLDLFGSAMNLCAKINVMAPKNTMVIGENLYQRVKSLADKYNFEKVGDYEYFPRDSKDSADLNQDRDNKVIGDLWHYSVYVIKSKTKRVGLNPFRQTL